MMHLAVSRRLSAYLDGELSPLRAGAVERHVARCATCASRLKGLRRTQAALRAAPPSASPAEGWARLRERMTAPSGARAWVAPRRRPLAWGIAAAAGILVLAAAALYLGAGPEGRARARGATSFVTTADLVGEDHVALSPSIELLLAARHNGGPAAKERP